MAEPPASTLYLDGRPIWHNPAGIGHVGIKLRKDVHEEELIRRMYIRRCLHRLRAHLGENANAD